MSFSPEAHVFVIRVTDSLVMDGIKGKSRTGAHVADDMGHEG
jgi:hypothetical protein